jgi:hypothetical protein
MSKSELLTRMTIWIALGGYAFAAGVQLVFRENRLWQSRARWAWTIGCLGLLLHLLCAFHFYHHWSQSFAYLETARQTSEVTGFDWGGGLYINYGFLAAWVIDVLWWWRGLESYNRRPLALVIVWQGFFLFMVFNATVIFKAGLLRWLGLTLCCGLSLLWWLTIGRKALARSNDKASNDKAMMMTKD